MLQRLSAMPHSAIAQDGSASSVAPKPSMARPNSNEWSKATARLNCGCAAALQDVAKETVPILSAAACWCCCACAGIARATATTAEGIESVRVDLAAVYPYEGPVVFRRKFRNGQRLVSPSRLISSKARRPL